LIADDEHLSRERLKRFLKNEPGVELVAECASGSEALKAIRQATPDIAFLDIRMPGLNAFEVLQSLTEARLPAIILVTAHAQFAPQAFDVDAIDYLLKPFGRERFQKSLRRARHRLQLGLPQSSAPGISTASGSRRPASKAWDRVIVKSSGCISVIKTVDIDWISSADNYVELHVGNKTHLTRATIAALENHLPQNQFARISRFVLVNLDRIKAIQTKSHGDYFVILRSGTRLPGSRNYRRGLVELLGLV
jgi:two-component system LytT family response regulator